MPFRLSEEAVLESRGKKPLQSPGQNRRLSISVEE
jgi:hypothetical protein